MSQKVDATKNSLQGISNGEINKFGNRFCWSVDSHQVTQFMVLCINLKHNMASLNDVRTPSVCILS